MVPFMEFCKCPTVKIKKKHATIKLSKVCTALDGISVQYNNTTQKNVLLSDIKSCRVNHSFIGYTEFLNKIYSSYIIFSWPCNMLIHRGTEDMLTII